MFPFVVIALAVGGFIWYRRRQAATSSVPYTLPPTTTPPSPTTSPSTPTWYYWTVPRTGLITAEPTKTLWESWVVDPQGITTRVQSKDVLAIEIAEIEGGFSQGINEKLGVFYDTKSDAEEVGRRFIHRKGGEARPLES